MRNVEQISTDRLLGYRLDRCHADLIFKMHSNERLMKTLGGIKTKSQSQEWLNTNIEHWNQHGFGIWMFFDQVTESFIGRAGIRNIEIDSNPEVEVAYSVSPENWGKGYATEMANSILPIAFEVVGLSELVAFTMTSHRASRRVMEKTGFIYERDIMHSDFACVLYRFERNAWVNR
ncbi:MAG: GNAT family N-acetyltransferase [Bdellovibrionales bacterium]|nr:GNAT family N-acetyltransferase [Bdellovibrionales bacterium]